MRSLILFCVFVSVCLVSAAMAQNRRASHCIALAEAMPGLQYLHRASWQAPPEDHAVRLHYINHASFLIETAGGRTVVTDYTGFTGSAAFIPDVVTMNHAHSTHWTANPDPEIPHVLPGWGAFGKGIDHHLDLGEILIRNVSTDIRSQYGGTEEKGNSIFVFEVAGLCIGHLGHLHHVPTPAQFAALGRLDVVMAPVDGGMTLPIDDMVTVLNRLRSSIVLPMHWFTQASLERFLHDISPHYDIEVLDRPDLTVSLRRLPDQPRVVVLRPDYLRAVD